MGKVKVNFTGEVAQRSGLTQYSVSSGQEAFSPEDHFQRDQVFPAAWKKEEQKVNKTKVVVVQGES